MSLFIQSLRDSVALYAIGGHDTRAEIIFLRYLGRWAKAGKSRTELLHLYLESFGKRSRWNGMDRNAVFNFARKCLKEERTKC